MQYDLIVIGGGPGGYVAAIRAAQLGVKVAVVEKENLGGTCLNWGCIPTKALVASASVLSNIKHAADFGINVGEFSVDFAKVMERKDNIVKSNVAGINYLFKKNKVDLFNGIGKFISKNTIEVTKDDDSKEVLEAKNIIIATGSQPALISALGYNGKTVITSEEALSLTEIPKSLLVIGGGVIGCEFASVFAQFGTEVTIVEALPRILPMVDEEVSKTLTRDFKKKKVKIKAGVMIKSVKEEADGVYAELENGDQIKAEKVLISIGRNFNTKGLGLEDIGVTLGTKGEIVIDDYLATNVEGVYAIGDVTNKIQLAHVASAQGIVCVENIFGKEKTEMNYSVVPSCIFTTPEIGSVGLTAAEAKEKGYDVKEGKFPFTASGKAKCIGETDGFVKFVADAATDKILGAHIVGPHASDLVSEAVLAVQMGVTVNELAKTIHAHPTLAESLMEAAEAVHDLCIHM